MHLSMSNLFIKRNPDISNAAENVEQFKSDGQYLQTTVCKEGWGVGLGGGVGGGGGQSSFTFTCATTIQAVPSGRCAQFCKI